MFSWQTPTIATTSRIFHVLWNSYALDPTSLWATASAVASQTRPCPSCIDTWETPLSPELGNYFLVHPAETFIAAYAAFVRTVFIEWIYARPAWNLPARWW